MTKNLIFTVLLACHSATPPTTRPTEGTVQADGAKLYYRMVGSGPETLVVIHGGPGMDSGYMVADFQPLAERYTLLFYDQRGGGRSETLPDDRTLFTMERHVADLEALRVHFGLERMTLVAHSFGPAIAAAYAMAHPDRVARMIFLGPLPPRAGEFGNRYGASLAKKLGPAKLDELAKEEDAILHGPDPVGACRRYWAIGVLPRLASPDLASRLKGDFCGAGAVGIKAGMSIAGPHTLESLGAWDFRAGLAAVTAPTLILHGEDDSIPMDLVEEWTSALPHAELLKIPGASHFPYVERPDVVWPAIETFLRRHPANSRP